MRFRCPKFSSSVCAKAFKATISDAPLSSEQAQAIADLIKDIDNHRRYHLFLISLEKERRRQDPEAVLVSEHLSGIKAALHRLVAGGEPLCDSEVKQAVAFLGLWDDHLAQESADTAQKAAAEPAPPVRACHDIFSLRPRKTCGSVSPVLFAR